jgi:hypothetical protein
LGKNLGSKQALILGSSYYTVSIIILVKDMILGNCSSTVYITWSEEQLFLIQQDLLQSHTNGRRETYQCAKTVQKRDKERRRGPDKYSTPYLIGETPP